jgi:hypothetical protein
LQDSHGAAIFTTGCAAFISRERSLAIRHMTLLHRSDKDSEWREGHMIQIDILLRTLVGKEGCRVCVSQPDGINSQTLQVAKALNDSIAISNAVAVCVLKTAWVNFVHQGMFSPG